MTAEPSGTTVEVIQLQSQPVLSIRTTVPIAALGEAHDAALVALRDYMQQHGIAPAAPPFVRYHTFEATETDLELGVPVAAPVASAGRIVGGELPHGPALSTWHDGSHDMLGDAYARLEAGLQAHSRIRDGAAWEVYCWIDVSQYHGTSTWPDPATWRTQLVQPINEA